VLHDYALYKSTFTLLYFYFTMTWMDRSAASLRQMSCL